MKCKDCSEPIAESERKATVTCTRCKEQMHGECAMSSETGDAFCEECLYRDSASFKTLMSNVRAALA